MARCNVTYSESVTRRAVHTFFWRRFKTPLGALYLGSFPILLGAIGFAYSIDGPNWFVGAMGFLLVMNLIIQVTSYFALPKAFVKRISDPTRRNAEIETSAEGVRVTNGPNALLLPWKMFKYIWVYDQYVILAVRPPMLTFVTIPTEGMTSDVRRDFEEAGVRPII